MKRALLCLLIPVAMGKLSAQTHNPGPNSNCKFSKGSPNLEKIMCPACEVKEAKEKEVKAVEDKRRSDLAAAKALAEQEAFEKARLEKLEREAAAEKKRLAEEEADRIAMENLRKKYAEIAANGASNSDVTGKEGEVNLTNLVPFYDDARKVYGFKLENIEMVILPYGTYQSVRIEQLAKTKYYSVRYWNAEFHHSSIVNYLGEIMEIEGVSEFDNVISASSDNTIYLHQKLSAPEYVVDLSGMYSAYFDDRASAIAFLKSKIKGGWGVYLGTYVTHITRYIVDFDLQVLEKKEVYVAGGKY